MLSEVLLQGLKKPSEQIRSNRLMIGYRKLTKQHPSISNHSFIKNAKKIYSIKNQVLQLNQLKIQDALPNIKIQQHTNFDSCDKINLKKVQKMTPLFRKVVSIDKWKNKYPTGYDNLKNTCRSCLQSQFYEKQKKHNLSLAIWKDNKSIKGIQEDLLKQKDRYSQLKKMSSKPQEKHKTPNFRLTFNSFYCNNQKNLKRSVAIDRRNQTQKNWNKSQNKDWVQRWQVSNQYDNQQLYL